MYLARLEDEARKAFLILANELIASDGVLEEAEIRAYRQMCYEAHLTEFRVTEMTLPKALSVLASQDDISRRIVLTELIALAVSDNRLADEEAKFLDRVAATLKIPEALQKRISEWVGRMIEVFVDGERLLTDSTSNGEV